MGSTSTHPIKEVVGKGRNERTHKDVFPPTIVACKVQPVLPQIVIRRPLRLDVDKVRAARARMARGAHAQGEEAVIRHVVRELAKQRRAELFSFCFENLFVNKYYSTPGSAHLVAKPGVAAADVLFVGRAHGEAHVSVEARCAELVVRRRCACWWPARRVVVKVKVGGGGAADVGVAAVGVVLDGLGRVEREERQGRAGGLLRALHLQDYSRVIFYYYVCVGSAMSGLPTSCGSVASDSA